MLEKKMERLFSPFVLTVITILSEIPILAHAADATTTEISGNVTNSKYLTITEHRFRPGEFTNQITGVIVNNST
jgi:hypothetical protein